MCNEKTLLNYTWLVQQGHNPSQNWHDINQFWRKKDLFKYDPIMSLLSGSTLTYAGHIRLILVWGVGCTVSEKWLVGCLLQCGCEETHVGENEEKGRRESEEQWLRETFLLNVAPLWQWQYTHAVAGWYIYGALTNTISSEAAMVITKLITLHLLWSQCLFLERRWNSPNYCFHSAMLVVTSPRLTKWPSAWPSTWPSDHSKQAASASGHSSPIYASDSFRLQW